MSSNAIRNARADCSPSEWDFYCVASWTFAKFRLVYPIFSPRQRERERERKREREHSLPARRPPTPGNEGTRILFTTDIGPARWTSIGHASSDLDFLSTTSYIPRTVFGDGPNVAHRNARALRGACEMQYSVSCERQWLGNLIQCQRCCRQCVPDSSIAAGRNVSPNR